MHKIVEALAPMSNATSEIVGRWLAVAEDFAEGEMSVDVFVESLRLEAAEWHADQKLETESDVASFLDSKRNKTPAL